MSDPARKDLRIVRGRDLAEPLIFQDATGAGLNLTGHTYAARIERSKDDPSPVTPTLDVTGLATGTIIVKVPAGTTANMVGPATWIFYETTGGLSIPLLVGLVAVEVW